MQHRFLRSNDQRFSISLVQQKISDFPPASSSPLPPFTSSFLSNVHVPILLRPIACASFFDSCRTEVLLLHWPDWSGGFRGT